MAALIKGLKFASQITNKNHAVIYTFTRNRKYLGPTNMYRKLINCSIEHDIRKCPSFT